MVVIFSVIIFYLVFIFYNDVNEFSSQWMTITFSYIPLILGLHFIVLLLRIIRQKILYDSLDVKISWKENLKIHMAGLSLIITPGGMGQTIKSYYLKNKFNYPYSKTVSVSLGLVARRVARRAARRVARRVSREASQQCDRILLATPSP